LAKDSWPFGPIFAGGIINVHFLLPQLFPSFERSLLPGGYLLLETVSGYGGNHLELPKAGELRSVLEKVFQFEFYQESPVGPSDCDAVTVRMLARKRPKRKRGLANSNSLLETPENRPENSAQIDAAIWRS
jgi:hypothetical protein